MTQSVNEKYLKIRHSLTQWQQEQLCKTAKSELAEQAPTWNKRISDGKTAFDEADFPLALAADALITVICAMEDKSLLPEEAQKLIGSYLQSKTPEEATSYQGLDDTQLRMYIHLVCQTVMNIMAESISSDEVIKSWRKNVCPACGSVPALAYYDGSGKRKLVCATCATHWQFRRLGCTACGEENHNNLRLLDSGSNCPGWSVQVCKTCHGYLKVVDLREITQIPDWILANVSTMPIDFAAQKWLSENA
ncbi:MAG: FdhE protein [Sporomusa sp.]|jgi:FdhE protein|nr:FdhE protein [Sporomusa sp.]